MSDFNERFKNSITYKVARTGLAAYLLLKKVFSKIFPAMLIFLIGCDYTFSTGSDYTNDATDFQVRGGQEIRPLKLRECMGKLSGIVEYSFRTFIYRITEGINSCEYTDANQFIHEGPLVRTIIMFRGDLNGDYNLHAQQGEGLITYAPAFVNVFVNNKHCYNLDFVVNSNPEVVQPERISIHSVNDRKIIELDGHLFCFDTSNNEETFERISMNYTY